MGDVDDESLAALSNLTGIAMPRSRLSDESKAKAMEDAVEAGLVGVNHPMVSMPETPFGGVNESGYGSEGGIEGLDAFLRTKFVTEVGV